MEFMESLSWSILDNLWQSWAISGHLRLSQVIQAFSGYLRLYCAILGYNELSQDISSYLWLYLAKSDCLYPGLFLVISGCFGLSHAISGYCKVSSIRMQVEAGESNSLLFEAVPFFANTNYRGVCAPKKLLSARAQCTYCLLCDLLSQTPVRVSGGDH